MGKRFDSPSVNDEVPVFRPKKKLLSFDQVMRRTPSSSDDVRQQRDLELDEVRNVRKSWCPPDESELSFNKISKSATVPDRLKITSVYCNDKKGPLVGKEERSQELLELRGNKGSTVRSIRKELEEINMGVAIREDEERKEVRKMFSDPSSHWQEERRRIQSEAERPSAASWENDVEPRFNNIPKVEPVYSMPKEKVVKHV